MGVFLIAKPYGSAQMTVNVPPVLTQDVKTFTVWRSAITGLRQPR